MNSSSMNPTLVEKVNAFDAFLGKDLEVCGYKAISPVHHARLRAYLAEAGYGLNWSEKVSPPSDFKVDYLMKERNLYARFAEGGIDVFVERNINTKGNGFSYLNLPTVQEYKKFEANYKRWVKTPLGNEIITVTSAAGSPLVGFAAGISFGSFLGGIAAFGGCLALSGSTAVVNKCRKQFCDKELKKMSMECNARRAILRAFHLSLDEGHTTEAEKENKKDILRSQNQKEPGVVDGVAVEEDEST